VNIRDRAHALGIDPDDPRYRTESSTFGVGEEWCPWCLRHGTTRPRLRCDVQQAEYALMDAETAAKCYHCHEPFTGEKHTLCPECQARDAYEAKKERKRRRFTRSNAVYRDDGHGCVERIHPTELKLLAGDRGEEGW
jgi:hypothetical protein